jgi:hypothetical protein
MSGSIGTRLRSSREPDLVRVIHEILIFRALKVLIGADFRIILQTVHA